MRSYVLPTHKRHAAVFFFDSSVILPGVFAPPFVRDQIMSPRTERADWRVMSRAGGRDFEGGFEGGLRGRRCPGIQRPSFRRVQILRKPESTTLYLYIKNPQIN